MDPRPGTQNIISSMRFPAMLRLFDGPGTLVSTAVT
jgi:hypothetical protein